MKVAVVGAGISGLVCAYELQKKGYDVTVFESEKYLGGRMSTDPGDILFDRGADFLSANYTHLNGIARELGVPIVMLKENSTHRILRDGKFYNYFIQSASDLLKLQFLSMKARLRFLAFLAKLKLGYKDMNFFNLSSLPAELDQESAAEFLTNEVHEEIKDYVADPFCGIMQFHTSQEISKAALFAMMKMSTEKGNNFQVTLPKGGMGAICEALGKQLPVRLNTPVTNITIDEQINVVHKRREVFDAVVLATTANAAHHILKTRTAEQDHILRSVEYASTLTVAIEIPDILQPLFCTYIPIKESKIIGGYTNEARKGYVSEGRTIVNVYLHEDAAKTLLTETHADIFEVVRDELVQMCPELEGKDMRLYKVQKWKHAMPKFKHHYLTLVKRFWQIGQGQNNVFLCGDYLNSPWTEGAARCGSRVAALVDKKLRA